ncbi:hypothetical protein [Dyadobacter sp. OTU695]|uniref:hypothetical protein n=1 Tax=Dyadobacter sp. OTU695 TaxID=3043860 RepID=UPI00313B7EA4
MKWDLGLNLYSKKSIIFEPGQLNSPEFRRVIAENKFHIYLVCKRKKIYFKSCERKEGKNEIVLYYLNDQHEKVNLTFSNQSIYFIDSWSDGQYRITVNDSHRILVDDYKLINLLHSYNGDLKSKGENDGLASDLEVLYVGQAFGRNKQRTIDYRLSNHEKVQKIALDILKLGSNEEVIIIGLTVDTSDIKTSFALSDSKTVAPTTENLKQILTKSKNRLSKGQEVTVYEASLIKYFRPNLNIEYKETFPSKDFISYNELYKIAFEYSAMEVNTEEIGVRLYSTQAPARKYQHSQYFPLETDSDKATLFEYLYELNSK